MEKMETYWYWIADLTHNPSLCADLWNAQGLSQNKLDWSIGIRLEIKHTPCLTHQMTSKRCELVS